MNPEHLRILADLDAGFMPREIWERHRARRFGDELDCLVSILQALTICGDGIGFLATCCAFAAASRQMD
jgi:hypothetical protein